MQPPPPPYAPPPPPSPSPGAGLPIRTDTAIAVVAYVLPFFVWFLGPLVLYLVTKREDKFNRFHSMQALLLSIAQTLTFFPFFFLSAFTTFGFPFWAGDPGSMMAGFGAAFAVFMFVALAACGLSLLFVVLYIVGAVKASRGEMWHLPILGPLADRWS